MLHGSWIGGRALFAVSRRPPAILPSTEHPHASTSDTVRARALPAPMSAEAWLALGVLAVVLALFLWNRLRPDVSALIGAGLLVGLGVITPQQGISGFASEATVTVALMLILSAGLVRVGVIDVVARRAARLVRGSEMRLLILILTIVVPVSAFVNNTAAVAVLLPVVLGLAKDVGAPPSRLLMPLSFGSQLGGTLTLIGTSTNLIVAALVVELGLPRIGLFDVTGPAILVMLAGVAYLLTLGRRLTPHREAGDDLLETYELHEYVTALDVLPDSPLIGRSLGESRFGEVYGLQVVRIERTEEPVANPRSGTVVRREDVLLVQGKVARIADIAENARVVVSGTARPFGLSAASDAGRLAEILIPPRSHMIGQSLRDLRFRARYGVSVLGVRRHGAAIHETIGAVRLDAGDILLVQGPTENLRALHAEGAASLIGVVSIQRKRRRRRNTALAIMAAVVLLPALGVTTILVSALFGVIAMFLTGCIEPQRAYEELDGQVLVLLAAMIPIGLALQQTGAAATIADLLVRVVAPLGPYGALVGIYILTSALTEMVSNAATAVVLTPIAVSLATSIDVSPLPFVVAVMFAASNSFATPIGYQTNLFIFGPGGYRFRDYLRVGGPLNVIVAIVATVAIPLFFPF
jgi:di/tricarboxylate transporter